MFIAIYGCQSAMEEKGGVSLPWHSTICETALV